jgi:uncharacterized protein YjiS (DUF1127 family)
MSPPTSSAVRFQHNRASKLGLIAFGVHASASRAAVSRPVPWHLNHPQIRTMTMTGTHSHSTIRISLPAPAQSPAGWPFLHWLDRMLSAAAHCLWLYRRRRGRRELLDLADHQLHDIGLTREQAEEIANRSFWR